MLSVIVTHNITAIMSECPICIEPYNKSTKSPTCCNNPSCKYKACKSCTRTYLMNSTVDLHCMNCRKSWDQAFVILNLNRSWFVNTYTPHHNNVLFERNSALIQDTMPDVVVYVEKKRIRKINAPKIKDIRTQITTIRDKMSKMQNDNRIQEENARKIYIDSLRMIRQAQEVINIDFNTEILTLQEARTELENESGIETNEKKQFIMPCQKEECKGFLSTQYKCGVCETQCCPKCLDIIEDMKRSEHVCNEDQVKTANNIKSTTKPCPKCGERIFKTEGCNQMWCITCHCAFDWTTGRIESGTVHNPHYFQFLRENNGGAAPPRQPGDDPCGNYTRVLNNIINAFGKRIYLAEKPDIDVDIIAQHATENQNDSILKTMNPTYHIYAESIYNFTRIITHFQHVEMTTARHHLTTSENVVNERVRWIVKDLSEESFRAAINEKNKVRLKYTDLMYIYDLIVNVSKDIVQGLLMKITDNNIHIDSVALKEKIDSIDIDVWKAHFESTFNEIQKFIKYCNDQFNIISMSHNCRVHLITSEKVTTRRRYHLYNRRHTLHDAFTFRIKTTRSRIGDVKKIMTANEQSV